MINVVFRLLYGTNKLSKFLHKINGSEGVMTAVASTIFIIFIALCITATYTYAQVFQSLTSTQANQSLTIQQKIATLQAQLAGIKQAQIAKQQAFQSKFLGPVIKLDQQKRCSQDQHTPTTYITYLQHFSCGHVSVFQNGTVLRKFTLFVSDYNGNGKAVNITSNGVQFHAWMFNGSLPGPTLRVTQGDHVQISFVNSKDSKFAHNLQMDSIAPGDANGISISPGHNFTYNFVALPAGDFVYYTYMNPTEEHISRGLFGQIIIDPTNWSPGPIEMVMTLNGYAFTFQGVDGSGHMVQTVPATVGDIKKNLTMVEELASVNGPRFAENEFYTINGMVFGYTNSNMIHLQTNADYRIYLANMLEFDTLNNFHLQGTLFTYLPSCAINSSSLYANKALLMQGDSGCVSFHYPYPGSYVFRSGFNHFTDLGMSGMFDVTSANSSSSQSVPIQTHGPSLNKLAGGALSPQEVQK